MSDDIVGGITDVPHNPMNSNLEAIHPTSLNDDDGKQLGKSEMFENKLVIEFFSGSGNLSAACRKIGLRAVSIDKAIERTKGSTTILDLTEKEDLDFVLQYIRTEACNVELIHCAPPCGTCSAARNNPLPHLAPQNFQIPAPLRSLRT